MPVRGSLETRFEQSTSDYADIFYPGVIEQAKKEAVQSGLRQLIDDTTAGVLLLKTENSVWCWLTGIPSSREDYTHTPIRYAIALQDDSGTMREWAGILCGLYSDKEQMQSLSSFLDGFIVEKNGVDLHLKSFDKIAGYLKDNIQPVPTASQIPDGCTFVLASYLAESDEDIRSVISRSDTVFWNEGDTGAFWNGSGGFTKCSLSIKKKRTIVPPVSLISPKKGLKASKRWVMSPKKGLKTPLNNIWLIASAITILILMIGIGMKLNSGVQTKECEKFGQEEKNLQDKSDVLHNRAASVEKERQTLGTRVRNLENQLLKKD